MGTPTFQPIANITLASTAFSVTFSGITQNFRDLVIIVNGLGATGNVKPAIRINGDSASNYSYVYMEGNGSTATSAAATISWMGETNATTGTTTVPVQSTIHLLDYSASDKHKSMLQRTDAAGSGTTANAGRWANNSPITSVQVLTTGASAWAAGTTFSMFGVIA